MDDLRLSRTHFKAMHLYFEQQAAALNDGGFDLIKVIELMNYQFKVPFTKDLIKDNFWRPIQIALTGKKSTTEITVSEANLIDRVFNKTMAEHTGISVPWPHDKEKGR